MSRLDYLWKRQLSKEQDEAFHTRNANKLLLRNILPDHVGKISPPHSSFPASTESLILTESKIFLQADFYLNMNRLEENELYHEFHNCVAVMFATLTDFMLDESDTLEDFNEIICEFDRLLFESEFSGKIEKIKLAGL